MTMNERTRDGHTTYQLFISAAIGVSRTVGGLPLEHPLDTIRTRWQANPIATRNAIQVAQEVMASKGFRGFYSGAIPNTTRRAIKQIYRWPMMLFLPSFYQDRVLSTRLQQQNPHLPKILTGLTIANFEVALINPLERLKVWLMTSPKSISLLEFFRCENVIAELYRGTSTVFCRQNVSWVTFLGTDELIKTKMRAYKQTSHLTHIDLFLTGIAVGGVNTAAVMPFDYIKTQKQKFFQNNKSMIDIFVETIVQHGTGRFYVGWKIYLVQYAIVAILTVNILEQLEQNFKKSKGSISFSSL